MNRIVLIGNGFDLAHGLKTRYQDFIDWYWKQRVHSLGQVDGPISEDPLCTFELKTEHRGSWRGWCNTEVWLRGTKTIGDFWQIFNSYPVCKLKKSPFFDNICKSIETKHWVDIENEYYRMLKECIKQAGEDEAARKKQVAELNEQLAFLQSKLVEYLASQSIDSINGSISSKLFAPIEEYEVSVSGYKQFTDSIKHWLQADETSWSVKLGRYNKEPYGSVQDALYYSKRYNESPYSDFKEFIKGQDSIEHRLPDQIMLLSFNYTNTESKYTEGKKDLIVNHIHGTLDNPSSIIFGYGDELDEEYKEILNKNDNDLLANVKSIRYLESDNYRKMLQFIDSAPFQIYIMGHSCGNSDRTLLNTLFEHKNCISIKPFYYTWIEKDKDETEHVKDNYLELVQNISRNFTDMKLMRDRVVNKQYCKDITK